MQTLENANLAVAVVHSENRMQSNQYRYEYATPGKCKPCCCSCSLDQAAIGPLHMWDYLPGELEVDGIYMFRGLRVGLRRVYNASAGQWQHSQRGGKTLECIAFTAIETVQDASVRC